jgi:hypothetical protein
MVLLGAFPRGIWEKPHLAVLRGRIFVGQIIPVSGTRDAYAEETDRFRAQVNNKPRRPTFAGDPKLDRAVGMVAAVVPIPGADLDVKLKKHPFVRRVPHRCLNW